MKVIGLTGSSGSGKSTVCSLLNEQGFAVIDCDQVSRAVLRPDTGCLAQIFAVFGNGVKNENGTLNRRALADIVFSDEQQLLRLNNIMYPQITADIRLLLENYRRSGAQAVILDAPTLFESGADALCDITVSVLSEDELRISRIMERDGIDREAAMRRLASQQSNAFYQEKSDYIIINSGSLELLREELQTLSQYLR